jgi:hypothetical protein
MVVYDLVWCSWAQTVIFGEMAYVPWWMFVYSVFGWTHGFGGSLILDEQILKLYSISGWTHILKFLYCYCWLGYPICYWAESWWAEINLFHNSVGYLGQNSNRPKTSIGPKLGLIEKCHVSVHVSAMSESTSLSRSAPRHCPCQCHVIVHVSAM